MAKNIITYNITTQEEIDTHCNYRIDKFGSKREAEITDIHDLPIIDLRKEGRIIKLPNDILGSQVKTLYRAACANIKADEIILPQSLKTINTDTFCGSTIKRIVFPKSLYSLEECALARCDKLESVIFTNGSVHIHYCWSSTTYRDIDESYADLFGYSTTQIKQIEVLGDEVSERLSLIILSYDLAFPKKGINIYPKYFKALTIEQLHFFMAQYQKSEATEKIMMVMQELNNRRLASLPEKFRTTTQTGIELL